MSFATFTVNWGNAFLLTVNRLTCEVPSKKNLGCLENALIQFPIDAQIRATHPLVLNGTTVSEKHSALVASQRALVQQCKAAGIPARAPTQELSKKQLILCLPDKTYAIFKTIVADEDLNPQTYAEILAKYCHQSRKASLASIASDHPTFTVCDVYVMLS